MSINQRIKELRNKKGLTQTDFGEQIGLKKTAASWIEQDGNTVTDQNIRLICAVFNVREKWLRDGEGSMFENETADFINKLAAEYSMTEKQKAFIDAFLHLKPEQREALLEIAIEMLENVKAQAAAPSSPTPFQGGQSREAALGGAAAGQAGQIRTDSDGIGQNRTDAETADERIEREAREEAAEIAERMRLELVAQKRAAAGLPASPLPISENTA